MDLLPALGKLGQPLAVELGPYGESSRLLGEPSVLVLVYFLLGCLRF